jgi:pyrophosphate--fructose-6-phosphate 1-phosphotransferase
MDRDPHGNVQVSRIDTEQLLIDMVELKLKEMKSEGSYKGKFAALNHFFGYEGRCAAPSNFDADYTYALGMTAVLLVNAGLTGYMATVTGLAKGLAAMVAGGVPITMMMNLEQRHGAKKPVIRKALVELSGKPFKTFAAKRDEWATGTKYSYPGPIQYFGPAVVADRTTVTLALEQS